MSISLYDEAVSNKINSWIPKSKNRTIQVLKPDEIQRLYQIEADETNDKPIKLPLVAISRDTTFDILQPTMVPMSFDGLMIESDGLHTLELNAIPISLSYQLDIYTRRFDEGDALLREFIFKIINNPQIVIMLPYNNQKFKHVATLRLQSQVEDTSAISERIVPGQFTRWTLKLGIDGAYLFSLPYVDNVNIELGDIKVSKNKDVEIKEPI